MATSSQPPNFASPSGRLEKTGKKVANKLANAF
jgi:hypothetical protein